MGNYSLVLALAGVIVGSTLLFNAKQSSHDAQKEVGRHAFKSIAREAALTGLNMTVRNVVADSTSWFTNLSANPSAYSYSDTEYRNGAWFSTTVQSSGRGYGAGEVSGICFIDTVDVTSVGYTMPVNYAGDEHVMDRAMATHKVEATYVRTCSDEAGRPPWAEYVTVSDQNFDIDGEIRVWSADASKNADVHSNRRLNVTDKAEVEGFGTQTRSSGGGCSDPCDSIFDPNDDTNGGASNFLRGQPEVDIPPLVPSEWLPKATYVESGDVRINSNRTIDFTDYRGITSHGTAQNPFIWYIDGDLEVNADLFRMIGYVIVIVEGGVKIDGDAQFITGVPAGESPPTTTYDSPNKNNVRNWMATHMPNGTTMGLYAAGCYDGDCGNSGIHLNGKAVVVGQLFANNDLSINGDATVFGAITTRNKMHYNGKNVIWYTGGSSEILMGGTESALPDGIRMIAFVEF